jgi:hypothetical protein
MTKEEKAKELFNKYYSYLKANLMYDEEAREDAKVCALILVDEVLNARPLDPNYVDWDDCGAAHQYWYEAQKEEALEFWQEVKTEIEKL